MMNTENSGAEDGGRTHHVEQSMPCDWEAFKHNSEIFVAYDVPDGPRVRLFRVQFSTRNVRVLAQADAVIYNGNFTFPYFDGDTRGVDFCHDYAGCIGTEILGEWLREPAVALKSLDHATGSELIDYV